MMAFSVMKHSESWKECHMGNQLPGVTAWLSRANTMVHLVEQWTFHL